MLPIDDIYISNNHTRYVNMNHVTHDNLVVFGT